MKNQPEDILLEKFLSSREGLTGTVIEYLYESFPNERDYQLVKLYIKSALQYGFECGKICENLGLNPEDINWGIETEINGDIIKLTTLEEISSFNNNYLNGSFT